MRTLLLAAGLALTAAACGSATSRSHTGTAGGNRSNPSGSRSASSFQASVTSATGIYAGEGGRARVSVQLRGSGASRPARLVFRSLPCQGSPQCLQLDGTLTGVMTQRRSGPPDTGRSFSVTAAGKLTTLGAVRATGAVHGTGFIAKGHELIDLTLTNRAGRITLRALSGSVRGFTSP